MHADFLNLKGVVVSREKTQAAAGSRALFNLRRPPGRIRPACGLFEPFSSADWKTKLVESASALVSRNQHAVQLGGRLNISMLDGMACAERSEATARISPPHGSPLARSPTAVPPQTRLRPCTSRRGRPARPCDGRPSRAGRESRATPFLFTGRKRTAVSIGRDRGGGGGIQRADGYFACGGESRLTIEPDGCFVICGGESRLRSRCDRRTTY
jgi:hypothetical protein